MRREILRENSNHFKFTAISLAVLTVLCFAFYGIYIIYLNTNNRAVQAVLGEITYTQDAVETEIARLQECVSVQPVSGAVRGELYRALAEVSYMTGDDMLYNEYIASALYYWNQVDDSTSIVYMLNKYIGRLYSNGCYESAEEILRTMRQENDMTEFSAKIQAEYYLSCADVAQMLGKDSSGFLDNARAAIAQLPQDGNRQLNRAKCDILIARCAIDNGDFASASAIMAGYSETDDFGLGEGQVYVVCDFEIPYHEIMTKLYLNENKFSEASAHADIYMELCDQYQFRVMRLKLLQYIAAYVEERSNVQIEKYRTMEQQVARETLQEMTVEYGEFLLFNIEGVIADMDYQQMIQQQYRRRAILAVIALYVLVIVYCFATLLLDSLSRDGLTELSNRQRYEKARTICEKKKVPYGLLMMDIDDFKKINDTFGHTQGDVVLAAIADILRSYSGRGITVYRYGGEEMCMIFLRVPEKRVREIAEEIRRKVEDTISTPEMHVTISGGVGVSVAGENVFQEADKRLYQAKGSGKNRIC